VSISGVERASAAVRDATELGEGGGGGVREKREQERWSAWKAVRVSEREESRIYMGRLLVSLMAISRSDKCRDLSTFSCFAPFSLGRRGRVSSRPSAFLSAYVCARVCVCACARASGLSRAEGIFRIAVLHYFA
jgi:hypothetical protein